MRREHRRPESARAERVSGRRGARAVSPGADARCSAGWRTRSARASTPIGRHLHHRPQRQLHERLRGASATSARSIVRSDRAEGYVLGFDEIFRKIDETIAVGGVQLLLQGGHNPDLPLTWYEDLVSRHQGALPDVQAARAVAARSDPPLAAVAAAGARGARAADRRRPGQRAGRRRRDSRRPRAQAAALLRQGDAPTNGSTSCATRTAPACARRRR